MDTGNIQIALELQGCKESVIREPSAVGSFWHTAVRVMGKRLPMHCSFREAEPSLGPFHLFCGIELLQEDDVRANFDDQRFNLGERDFVFLNVAGDHSDMRDRWLGPSRNRKIKSHQADAADHPRRDPDPTLPRSREPK